MAYKAARMPGYVQLPWPPQDVLRLLSVGWSTVREPALSVGQGAPCESHPVIGGQMDVEAGSHSKQTKVID